MTIEEMIRAVQEEIGVRVDGRAGPETWGTIHRLLVKKDGSPAAPSDISTVDARSEKHIQTLHARLRPLARALVHAAALEGIAIQVISGTRTFDEQNALYAQGRTKPGKRVTNARGGHSNHNFRIAFDVTIFKGGKPAWESPAYKAIGAMGRALGLEWGGDWTTFKDQPHFQLRPEWAEGMSEKAMLAELRARHARGQDAFS